MLSDKDRPHENVVKTYIIEYTSYKYVLRINYQQIGLSHSMNSASSRPRSCKKSTRMPTRFTRHSKSRHQSSSLIASGSDATLARASHNVLASSGSFCANRSLNGCNNGNRNAELLLGYQFKTASVAEWLKGVGHLDHV